MSKVASDISRIQKEIAKLPPDKVRRLARWLEGYEEDAKAGRLDKLTKRAMKEIEAGQVQPLDEFLRNR